MIYDHPLDAAFTTSVQSYIKDNFCLNEDTPTDIALPHFFNAAFVGSDFVSEIPQSTAEVSRNTNALFVVSIEDLPMANVPTIQCLGLPQHPFFRTVDIDVPLFPLLRAQVHMQEIFFPSQPRPSSEAEYLAFNQKLDRKLVKELRLLGQRAGRRCCA
jgi:hypothetical protein